MKLIKIILILILFLINIIAVQGAGIGSDKLTYQVEFEPNKNMVFEYQLITTSTKTMDYELYVMNEDEIYGAPEELRINFRPYVQFKPEELKNIAPGANPRFKAKIILPEKIKIPGEHGLRICVQEGLGTEGTVGSRSGGCGRIRINIPYPGKFLIISLKAFDTDVGKTAKLELFLNSRGEQDINEVKGVIEIYDENDKLVKTLNIEKTSLKSKERKTTELFLDTINFKPGEYTAKAKIQWDGGLKEAESKFLIGAAKVELLEITKTYRNNTINPVEMKIKNNWNKQTENIYAAIETPNGEIKTPTATLEAWQEGLLNTYWDTTGLEIGNYHVKINLHYADKQDIYKETFIITEKPIELERAKVKMPISGLLIGIIGIVALLIILNIVLLLKLTKRK